MLPLTRVAGRVATATDFAAAMQHMIREVVPEGEQYRMRIMVDEAAGHVLQSQGEDCIVFASQGPHLLQIGLSNLPSSFKPAPGSLAPQAANLDECRSWSTCGSCTGSFGCGWCSADNKCKTGGSSGSNDGSCPRSSLKWHYLTSSCPGAKVDSAVDIVEWAGSSRVWSSAKHGRALHTWTSHVMRCNRFVTCEWPYDTILY
jgi:hypothetical protein